ncbi:proteasome core particle subunit beta 3 [Binucleata daphniae]
MSNIKEHYGGSVLAIKNKNAIVLMSDLRFGQGNLTVNYNHTKIYKIGRHFILMAQFIPDAQALYKKILKNHNLFVLNEDREMEPFELANMVSYILYSKRNMPYFTSPIVAGIDSEGKPYICGMDQLGCMSNVDANISFAVSGTAENNLAGFCEALIGDEINNEDLFTASGQIFLNSIDRDARSGWGCEGYLIEKNKVTKRRLGMRMD